jgi:hypothetical protein
MTAPLHTQAGLTQSKYILRRQRDTDPERGGHRLNSRFRDVRAPTQQSGLSNGEEPGRMPGDTGYEQSRVTTNIAGGSAVVNGILRNLVV